MSSTYAPQVDMGAFGLESQDLTLTDPGFKKEFNMQKKKLASTDTGQTAKYL
jgi:hypothetical protein